MKVKYTDFTGIRNVCVKQWIMISHIRLRLSSRPRKTRIIIYLEAEFERFLNLSKVLSENRTFEHVLQLWSASTTNLYGRQPSPNRKPFHFGCSLTFFLMTSMFPSFLEIELKRNLSGTKFFHVFDLSRY